MSVLELAEELAAQDPFDNGATVGRRRRDVLVVVAHRVVGRAAATLRSAACARLATTRRAVGRHAVGGARRRGRTCGRGRRSTPGGGLGRLGTAGNRARRGRGGSRTPLLGGRHELRRSAGLGPGICLRFRPRDRVRGRAVVPTVGRPGRGRPRDGPIPRRASGRLRPERRRRSRRSAPAGPARRGCRPGTCWPVPPWRCRARVGGRRSRRSGRAATGTSTSRGAS